MSRHEEIKNAYKRLGREATFYDGMITCSTLPGKAVCKLVWNMNKRKNDRYLGLALSGIPENFSGKMLEVPVGTGVLSMPVYETLPDADITCVDYSPDMMERAKRQAQKRGLKNVRFMQGDVGNLSFADESFDLVLGVNMRILVYGAGVLGCNLANNLYHAKKDVTLLARGAWAEQLKQNGLHMKKTFHLRESVSRVPVITQLEPEDCYDVIFVVVRYTQLDGVMEDLRANGTKNIVFVSNNTRPAYYASLFPEKNIMFAFALSAGHREPARVVSLESKRLPLGS